MSRKQVSHPQSLRIPAEWYDPIVRAAGEDKSQPNIGRWIAWAAMTVACQRLGEPEPVLAAPTRDEIRAAAKAAGMTPGQFEAWALIEAVRHVARTPSEAPPAPAEELAPRPRSGTYALRGMTPAQGFRAVREGAK